jgi:protein BCP1
LELGDFADILIEENQVGTTVKVDDQKSDPYAVLSIINLNQNKVNNHKSCACTHIDILL